MWKTCAVAAIAAMMSSYAFAQSDQVSDVIAACAQDTGPADCPATYQALHASDCLGSNGNRSCLIRMAKEAAAANDCARAYQLAYACQCHSWQDAGRASFKAAGADAVCKALRGS
jgi:hypothetical protein